MSRHFDLMIIGTGSGNMIPGPEFDDRQIALVERGTFGGTCLNVGCIPSKMFVYAADVAETIRHAEQYGVTGEVTAVDWPSIVNRVFGRIDPIAEGGRAYRIDQCENITVFEGEGRFVGDKQLEVNGERITAEQVIIGAGSRPFIPPFPGIDDVEYYTSDTVMRVPELPESMVVLGGGYIAAELGHVFGALGTDVTIVNRSPVLLRYEDQDIRERFTEIYSRRFNVLLSSTVSSISQVGSTITVDLDTPDGTTSLSTDLLLVATGRIPNSDTLDVAATGVTVYEDGRVIVDEALETVVAGIWAFGDITNRFQLKHLANTEAAIVSHNVRHPSSRRTIDYTLVPHAVFGHPQVATVGLTEVEAVDRGIPCKAAIQDYSGVAYGWAIEDTDSFCKLIVNTETRLLIGAHIIGPQASTLIQQLIQGMRFGQTVDEMASGMMYIHPALTEVVENALLQL